MSEPKTEITAEPTKLKRQFKMRDAFTLAFVYISPIVALYAVFGLVIQVAGPAGWWAFAIVLVLQIFVALSLGTLVSRWPYQGGSYQYARRLVGENYGWITGWVYICLINTVIAANAFAIATFIPPMLGIPSFSLPVRIGVAAVVIVVLTLLNLLGPAVLKVLSTATLIAELLGSVVLATVLLIWYREQDFSVLFTSAGASEGNYWLGGFILAVGFVGFGLAGFESVVSLAEEVEEPEKNLPKALVGALIAIGAIVLYSSLALILATPDFGKIIHGTIMDPAAETITHALGSGIAQPFFAMVVLGFAASTLMAQTSISRVIWSFARDGAFPAAKWLSKLSIKHRTPNRAIIVVGAIALVILLAAASERVYQTLIAASTSMFFITMGLVILALLGKMLRKKWTSGPFNLGVLTIPVVIIASVWIAFEVINLVWPRGADEQPWYVTWAVLIGLGIFTVLGFVVWLTVRKGIRANSETPREQLDVALTRPVAVGDARAMTRPNGISRQSQSRSATDATL